MIVDILVAINDLLVTESGTAMPNHNHERRQKMKIIINHHIDWSDSAQDKWHCIKPEALDGP
jgi:hypothetical protein